MSENRLCGAATALMWSNMLVSHSAISRRVSGSFERHSPPLPVSTPSWANWT